MSTAGQTERSRVQFLQGNEVCAEAALYAGMRYFAGYPITPSTEIAERLAERLPQVGGSFMQMEDEIGSICAVIGASLAGTKSMTATSGPGFSLMQEAIGYAVMAEIPCVIVDVQRGGPSTGLPTHASQGDVMQVRYGTHGDHSIVCLTASNHQDLFGIVVDAFNFSEVFRTPAVVLIDEVVGHMREAVRVPEPGELDLTERLLTDVPRDVDYHPYAPREDDRLPMSNFGGVHRYNVTGLVHDMWGFPSEKPKIVNDLIHHLYLKLENRKQMLTRWREWSLDDAEIVLISYGSSARSARHIMENRRSVGVPIGMIELQTLWPFPSEMIRTKCRHAEYIVVVEMNMGQIVHEVKRAVDRPERVFLSNRVDGEMITPTDIKHLIRVIQGKGV
ncbi:MAG: 2-oxoacid:acceptor oxidoreductase subunit alpha [Spirochaetaceae bacterium]|nr:MAG: 2-oxoacid:acceptor oxidoreductase subunit alpha [Spirochaetaceae bacterium]